MGVCVNDLKGNGEKLEIGANAEFIWIVMRRQDRGELPGQWHIQGIADTEKLAILMCKDETYFIGPLPKNVSLPHDTIEWINCYFPLKKDGDK
jgi:hypothetical protein